MALLARQDGNGTHLAPDAVALKGLLILTVAYLRVYFRRKK